MYQAVLLPLLLLYGKGCFDGSPLSSPFFIFAKLAQVYLSIVCFLMVPSISMPMCASSREIFFVVVIKLSKYSIPESFCSLHFFILRESVSVCYKMRSKSAFEGIKLSP